jgi:hypothetical protein
MIGRATAAGEARSRSPCDVALLHARGPKRLKGAGTICKKVKIIHAPQVIHIVLSDLKGYAQGLSSELMHTRLLPLKFALRPCKSFAKIGRFLVRELSLPSQLHGWVNELLTAALLQPT